jgi:hypothetical protein
MDDIWEKYFPEGTIKITAFIKANPNLLFRKFEEARLTLCLQSKIRIKQQRKTVLVDSKIGSLETPVDDEGPTFDQLVESQSSSISVGKKKQTFFNSIFRRISRTVSA